MLKKLSRKIASLVLIAGVSLGGATVLQAPGCQVFVETFVESLNIGFQQTGGESLLDNYGGGYYDEADWYASDYDQASWYEDCCWF